MALDRDGAGFLFCTICDADIRGINHYYRHKCECNNEL